MNVELLKLWQKGLRETRDKIMQKPQADSASFKEKLLRAKMKNKGEDEDFLEKFTLIDAYVEKQRETHFQRRRANRKRLEQEAEAIATQRIRKIKAENFLRARYDK